MRSAREPEKLKNKNINIEVVNGVGGDCLIIDGNRISGPKPLGGGTITHRWKVNKKELIELLQTKGVK